MEENKQNDLSELFVKIAKKEIPSSIVYEDDKHIAFLDIQPFEKGHTLLIPKKKYECIWDMPENEFLELSKVLLKISKNIKEKLNCGLNITQNNKQISGQIIPHIHFHLVPRLEKKPYHTSINTKYSDKDEILKYQNLLKL